MELNVVIVILLFSVIQSVIGVGVLLFGTPTLLLMGYSYHETLFLILPSSILISLLQSIKFSKLVMCIRYTFIYTLPAVFLGLLIVTIVYDEINIKYIVGAMLILVGFIKSIPIVRQHLKTFFHSNVVLYNVVMGGVHGVSNMGGGLLVVQMSTLYDKRDVVLANIAYTYLLFGIIQMITLLIFSQELVNIDAILLAFLSLVVYILASRFIVKRVNDIKFNFLTTLLIFFYGILSFFNIG